MSHDVRQLTGFPDEFDFGTSMTAGNVNKWRREMEAFLSGEWTQLHTLIRRMEEEVWRSATEPPLSDSDAADPLYKSSFFSPLEHLPRTENPEPGEPDGPQTASTHGNSRLDELARRIEERMRLARSHGD